MNTKEFFNAVAEKWDANEPYTREQIQSFLLSCGLQGNKRTLDLGCGTGVISDILLQAGCAVTALDLSEKMIEAAKKKHAGKDIRFVCGDFYSFSESGFEQVVLFNAYPHFLDRAAFVKKLASVLSEGGTFLIAHNIGREALSRHHSGVKDISCELLPVLEESKYFSPSFTILSARETENSYLIRGQRK